MVSGSPSPALWPDTREQSTKTEVLMGTRAALRMRVAADRNKKDGGQGHREDVWRKGETNGNDETSE